MNTDVTKNNRPFTSLVKKILLSVIFVCFLTGISNKSFASGDDSLTVAAKKRANKVALMSAIVPGLGQVMNKKYWKVPIIYGGGLTLAYFIKINNQEYKNYQEALIQRSDTNSTAEEQYPNFSDQELKNRKDYYRRNRDLCYIFAGVLYVLNIVDAYVDAQLMDFDVSDNLSLRINPYLNATQTFQPVPSLNIVLNFK